MSIGHDHFIFGETPEFFEPFSIVEHRIEIDGGQEFLSTLLSFKGNLSSAFRVASIPYQLVHVAVLNQRLLQLRTAEGIRGLTTVGPGEELDRDGLEKVGVIAHNRFSEELRDPTVIEKHAHKTLNTLEAHLEDEQFRISADELLRQVLVMSWGAFEAFFNDAVRDLLNANPRLMRELMSVKEYRDLVMGRGFIEILASHDFDLSARMGDVFCDAVKLDGLEAIKTVSSTILSSANVNTVLKSKALWKIAQQRHLIVHRRAVVDAQYLRKSDDIVELGQRLNLSAEYVEQAMETLRDVGLSCFQAVLETHGQC